MSYLLPSLASGSLGEAVANDGEIRVAAAGANCLAHSTFERTGVAAGRCTLPLTMELPRYLRSRESSIRVEEVSSTCCSPAE